MTFGTNSISTTVTPAVKAMTAAVAEGKDYCLLIQVVMTGGFSACVKQRLFPCKADIIVLCHRAGWQKPNHTHAGGGYEHRLGR